MTICNKLNRIQLFTAKGVNVHCSGRYLFGVTREKKTHTHKERERYNIECIEKQNAKIKHYFVFIRNEKQFLFKEFR